jgi:hypothetical protein
VFAAPVVYYAFFDGIRRHPGFEVSDALRVDPDPPPESLAGVLEFHREWLARDPLALVRLYLVKLARTWYLSDSGRWDRWILLVHAPIWLLALPGLVRWLRAARRDPALWLVVSVVVYLWLVSAAVSDLARYMAPVYGLLGLLAGVALIEGAAEGVGGTLAHEVAPTKLQSGGPRPTLRLLMGQGPLYGLACYRPFVSEFEPYLRAWRKRRGEEMMDSTDGRPEITTLGSS